MYSVAKVFLQWRVFGTWAWCREKKLFTVHEAACLRYALKHSFFAAPVCLTGPLFALKKLS